MLNHCRELLIILTAVLSIVLSGCGGPRDTPVTRALETQILYVGNATEPSEIDPHITTGIPENRIQQALFEGLTAVDPKTLEIIPAAAKSWAVSDDGKTYTFYLQPDGKWSNGEPVTAHDFVWSLERALVPTLANEYSSMLHYIKNAKAFNEGKLTDFSTVGVTAVNDFELKIELNHPVGFFTELVAHHSYFPVHPPTLKKFGADKVRGTPWTRPENFVGNGPFTLTSWKINQLIVVAKNPNYWDAETVNLNEIHFLPIGRASSEELMYRAGQLHITSNLPTSKIAVYKEKDPQALITSTKYSTYYYIFNVNKPPLNKAKVRRALSYAIDRERLVEYVTKGGELAAYSLVPPENQAAVDTYAVKYNKEEARKLLAEAGYPNGKGFPKLTILYNTLDGHQKIALVIQQMLKEVLNIDIVLRNEDWKVFLATVTQGDFEIARAGWLADYFDPSSFLDLMVSDNGMNRSGFKNTQYDQTNHLAAIEKDPKKRIQLLQQAEDILQQEMPLIPLYYYSVNRLVHPTVHHFYANYMDVFEYKKIKLLSGQGE